MNCDDLFDEATAEALDVAWLTRAIEPVHEAGRRAFVAVRPFVRGEEAQAQARANAVAEAASLGAKPLDALRDILAGTPDATSAIARLSAGDTLEDDDLLIVLRFCDGAARAFEAACDLPSAQARGRVSAFAAARGILEPGRVRKTAFYLSDAFGTAVREGRAAQTAARDAYDAARAALVKRARASLQRDDVGEGEFIVMRDAAPAPIPAGVRVVREAPTYLLCELELDEPALAALRARDDADDRVAAAEGRARDAISQRLREHVPGLEAGTLLLAGLDMLVAAARFAGAYACAPATIVDEAVVDVTDARFLPLAQVLAAEGHEYAPVSLDALGVLVITGPNMGGKTTALRACGAIALYAALGLPVPAARARVGLFDRIAWLGVGVRDVAQGSLLSAFASEVVRLRDALPAAQQRTLFLSDELARTTTPHEAAALLIAVIRRLRERGACGLLATHVAGIATASGARHFAVRGLHGVPEHADGDLSRALASLAASMDYTLSEVSQDAPAQDDALALASLLGLDSDVVADARQFLQGTRRT